MRSSFIRSFAVSTFVVLTAFAQTALAEYNKQTAPLMTPWGEQLTTDNVLAEYPRPQMRRSSWMNLNGVWQLGKGTKGEGYSSSLTFNRSVLVPFPIESALSGIMEESDSQCWWYRRTFTLPDEMKGKRILLHFDAVDWEARAYVNGTLVGTHTGGYDPFAFDITDALRASGEQTVTVYTYDDTGAEGQMKGKQALNKWGCWYTPVSGIWQTVWLEPVADAHVTALSLEPDVDHQALKVQVESSAAGTTADITATDHEGHVVASATGIAANTLANLAVSEPHLWSPDDPYLYDLQVVLRKGDVATDTVDSYFAMRKIEVKRINKIPRILLNGSPIFQMGLLDQGWWPDGLYTAPSDEALIFDIQKMKDLGFNMLRKHIKVEPSRWYYHCDRLGMLVWQDMPSPGLPSGYESYAKKNFEDESLRIMKAFGNHPSIVQWIVFNEGWGQFDTERMTQVVIDHKGQQLVCCASGWTHAEIGDIRDLHSYPHPSCPVEQFRAGVAGEYGGITLQVPGHMWPGGNFGYVSVEAGDDFTAYFNMLADEIIDQEYMGLNAAVYTQVSDVEIEYNGIYTYDRRILKPGDSSDALRSKVLECIAAIKSPKKEQVVLSTSRNHKYTWRYTASAKYAADWYRPGFDDSAWQEGKSAFGQSSMWNTANIVSTRWATSQLHLRRWFRLGDVTEEMLDAMRFVMYHDDDIRIYINGVLAATRVGCTSSWMPYNISYEGRRALKPNDWNLIAVECLQGSGEQIVDVGISIFSDKDYGYVEDTSETVITDYEPSPAPADIVAPLFEKVAYPVPAEPSANNVVRAQFYHTSDRNNVAWGDCDGDGLWEIAYSGKNIHLKNPSLQVTSVLYDGTEAGTFTKTSNPFAKVLYGCPVWMDYDNDGRLDLVMPGLTADSEGATPSDMVAYVFHNTGNNASGHATFQEVNESSSHAFGLRPLFNSGDGGRARNWVDCGDYDGDGYTDIIMTGTDLALPYEILDDCIDLGEARIRQSGRVVYLYRNLQGQGFELQTTPVEGERAFQGLNRGTVRFADMDGDGRLDIVSSGYGPGEGTLLLYFNNGDGSFRPSPQSFKGPRDGGCEIADFDGDGWNDILCTGYSEASGSTAKSIYIYHNVGGGLFEMTDQRRSGFEGIDGGTPAVGDVNNDGIVDILVGGHGSDHEITTWLYLGRGDLTFMPAGAWYQNDQPYHFGRISHGNNHLVDYDGDGYLDAWNMGWAQTDVCSRGCATELWKNTSASVGIAPNAAPSAPGHLSAALGEDAVTFCWDAATDDTTPTTALRYNLFVRRSGSDEVFCLVPADPATGKLKTDQQSALLATTSVTLHLPLTDGQGNYIEYEWGVQSVDAGKCGSAFACGHFSTDPEAVRKMKFSSLDAIVHDGVLYYDLPAGTVASLTISDTTGITAPVARVRGKGHRTLPFRGINVIRLTEENSQRTLTFKGLR